MKKSILIIDDSESVRLHLQNILVEAGHEVIAAIHGFDALEKCNGSKYHIIICDLIMPLCDGLQFVKEIKSNEHYSQYKFVPIVMLTTISDESKKLEGQTTGVKAWVEKPIVPEMILKVVEKLSISE